MRFKNTIIGIILNTIFLMGCATYHSRPLNNEDLTTALTADDKCQLTHAATLLNHPQIPPISLDFSKPLSGRELAVVAVLVNPDLKALRAKEGVASAQVFDAGLLPDPQLALGYARSITKGPGIVDAYNYAFALAIGDLATRQVRRDIQETARQQTRYDIAWQEWLLANQTQLLSAKIYFLNKKNILAKKIIQTIQEGLKILHEDLANNKAKVEEVAVQQTVFLDMLDQSVSAERELIKTKLSLNQLLGLCPSESISLKLGELPILKNLNADCLFEEAKVNRLDLLALQAGYLSQEAKLYQAILGQFPHCNIGMIQGRDDTDIHFIGPTIILDVPLFNRNQGAIAIQETTREQLNLEYLARLNQTRSDIAILVADITLLKKEENILQKELVGLRNAEQRMRKALKPEHLVSPGYSIMLTSLLTNEFRLLTVKQSIAEQMIALQIATGRYCQ